MRSVSSYGSRDGNPVLSPDMKELRHNRDLVGDKSMFFM